LLAPDRKRCGKTENLGLTDSLKLDVDDSNSIKTALAEILEKLAVL